MLGVTFIYIFYTHFSLMRNTSALLSQCCEQRVCCESSFYVLHCFISNCFSDNLGIQFVFVCFFKLCCVYNLPHVVESIILNLVCLLPPRAPFTWWGCCG